MCARRPGPRRFLPPGADAAVGFCHVAGAAALVGAPTFSPRSGGAGEPVTMSALSALAEQGIHADRDGLHLVPPEDMERSAALQRDSQEFLNKTKQFDELVSDLIQVMESRSKVIEAEKLKAIGLGNRIDSEQEVRRARACGGCDACVREGGAGAYVWTPQRTARARAP